MNNDNQLINLVYESNNIFLCDSRIVAKLFNAEHSIILDDINFMINKLKYNHIKDLYIKEEFLYCVFIFKNNKTGFWYEMNHKAFSLLTKYFTINKVNTLYWINIFNNNFKEMKNSNNE